MNGRDAENSEAVEIDRLTAKLLPFLIPSKVMNANQIIVTLREMREDG